MKSKLKTFAGKTPTTHRARLGLTLTEGRFLSHWKRLEQTVLTSKTLQGTMSDPTSLS